MDIKEELKMTNETKKILDNEIDVWQHVSEFLLNRAFRIINIEFDKLFDFENIIRS